MAYKILDMIKPTVQGKSFLVDEGDGSLYYIDPHDILDDHFRIWTFGGPEWGFPKKIVWQLIDKKQWIIQ